MDGIVTLVRIGNEILAIIDRPDDRFAGCLVEEYLLGTEIGCWSIQAIDEVAREKLFVHIIAIGIRIDEDIGERRCRISNIARLREQTQNAANHGIRPGRVQVLLVRVDRCVVGLVVDQQHGHVGDAVFPFGVQLLQPFVQCSERRDVLLDDQDDRLAEVVDLPAALGRCVLVEVLVDVGESCRMRISRSETDANIAAILGIARSADEGLIDALLCLPAQIVVNAGNDDDELVARIGCTCYQTRVVGRLSRLHMADD